MNHEDRTITLKLAKENDFNNFRVNGKSTDEDNFKKCDETTAVAAFIDRVMTN